MTSWSIHTFFTALQGYELTRTKKDMNQPRRHTWSTLYLILHNSYVSSVMLPRKMRKLTGIENLEKPSMSAV